MHLANLTNKPSPLEGEGRVRGALVYGSPPSSHPSPSRGEGALISLTNRAKPYLENKNNPVLISFPGHWPGKFKVEQGESDKTEPW